MLHIENNYLRIDVLDPQKDKDKQGSRYCTGGQIYQVHDKEKGELLAGPMYPKVPNPFDSQGLPDAFDVYPGFEDAQLGDLIMAIGVGLVRYTTPIVHSFARENTDVVEALDWKMQKADNALGFYAIHDYKDHAYALTREIILEGRELVLVNVLENCGSVPLPLSWFAHPFFPPTSNGVIGRIPATYTTNEYYSLTKEGALQLRCPENYSRKIHDSPLFNVGKVAEEDGDISMEIYHDKVGKVRIDCGFPVAKIPFWFCDTTCSPEPYLIDELEPAENAQWEIVYTF